MKMLFTLLLLFVSLLSFGKVNNADNREDGIGDLAFYSMIVNRCHRYLPLNEWPYCRNAVAAEISILDSDITLAKKNLDPKNFVFIAFKSTLTDLLSQNKTTQFLTEFLNRLNRHLNENSSSFNLWEMTYQFYKSQFEAARILAVLFQDVSAQKLHLAYLELNSPSNPLLKENIKLLARAIDTLNMVVDYSKDFKTILYPEDIPDGMNRNVYHFYVPYYVSLALKKKGIERKFAFIASLFLNMVYEFVTVAKDYRYLFADPERLDPTIYEWKLQDIYSGYVAAGLAVNKFPLSFEVIKESFARSTKDSVELMLSP